MVSVLCRVLVLALAASAAFAQDYAREKRWADEVLPAIVVGEPVWIRGSSGREFLGLYARHAREKGALVIVHGVGVHPDHGVIGILRSQLADRGFTTLAIQMPVQAKDAKVEDYHPGVFPEAIARIEAAARWLDSRGHERLALVSHSMGSWMANEHFDAAKASPYRAWACLGLTGGYSWGAYASPRPILDVYGSEDLPPVLDAAWRRRLTIASAAEGSRQVRIEGANHHYEGKEPALADAIAGWLAQVLK